MRAHASCLTLILGSLSLAQVRKHPHQPLWTTAYSLPGHCQWPAPGGCCLAAEPCRWLQEHLQLRERPTDRHRNCPTDHHRGGRWCGRGRDECDERCRDRHGDCRWVDGHSLPWPSSGSGRKCSGARISISISRTRRRGSRASDGCGQRRGGRVDSFGAS